MRIATDDTLTQETLAARLLLCAARRRRTARCVAVGDDGTVLQHSGSDWNLSTPDDATLYSAFALDANTLLVAGSGGAYLSNQTPEDTGAVVALFGVWARSATDVFAAGEAGTLLHRSDAWSALDSTVSVDLHAISGDGSLVMAVGAGGTILVSSDGTSFGAESSGSSADLDGLWLGGGEALRGRRRQASSSAPRRQRLAHPTLERPPRCAPSSAAASTDVLGGGRRRHHPALLAVERPC